MSSLHRAAGWLVLLAAAAAPAPARAKDFDCEDACRLFQQRCVDVLPAKQHACRVACAVGGEVGCAARCRLAARDERRGCRSLTRRCTARCAATVADSSCVDGCAADARACLREQTRAAPACVAGCGGTRSDATSCRFDCYRSWQRGNKACLRAAPICVNAVRAAFDTCQAACGASADPLGCGQACRQTRRAARRACLAQPESGLFACLTVCAGSPVGSFLGTGHEGRQAD